MRNTIKHPILEELGYDDETPTECVIPPESLRKIIGAIGLQQTLYWINGERAREL